MTNGKGSLFVAGGSSSGDPRSRREFFFGSDQFGLPRIGSGDRGSAREDQVTSEVERLGKARMADLGFQDIFFERLNWA